MKKILLASAVAAVASTSAFAAPTSVIGTIDGFLDTAYNKLDGTFDPSTLDSLEALIAQHGRVKTTTSTEIALDTDTTADDFEVSVAADVTVWNNSNEIDTKVASIVDDVNLDIWGDADGKALTDYSTTVLGSPANGLVGGKVNDIIGDVNAVNAELAQLAIADDASDTDEDTATPETAFYVNAAGDEVAISGGDYIGTESALATLKSAVEELADEVSELNDGVAATTSAIAELSNDLSPTVYNWTDGVAAVSVDN